MWLPGKPVSLPLPKGVNGLAGAESAFTRDGSRLLYSHNGPTSPKDVWVYSVADGKSQQITHSLVAGVRSEDMVEPFLGAIASTVKKPLLHIRVRVQQHGAQRTEARL